MKRKSKKQKRCSRLSVVLLIVTLVALLPALTGCGIFKKDIVLHPITGQDIKLLNYNETFTAPKQGAFLSDYYIQEVMEAKVKQ